MNTPQPEPRLFHLVRPTGTVAEGVEWSDGTVTLRWRGQCPATSVWEGGVDALLAVHGRNGAAELRWLAPPPNPAAGTSTPHPTAGTGTPAATSEAGTAVARAPATTGTAVAPGSPAAGSGAGSGRPTGQWMDWQTVNGLRLAAPGVDGRCVSCGLVWPCLSCGP